MPAEEGKLKTVRGDGGAQMTNRYNTLNYVSFSTEMHKH